VAAAGGAALSPTIFNVQTTSKATMLEMFIGAVDIHRFNAFIQGSELTLYYNRVPNDSYQEFLAWLRDVKQEFPQGGGWARKCLEDCGGDHLRAIQKFLELAAEFASQHKVA
jgi:hypothetical protein